MSLTFMTCSGTTDQSLAGSDGLRTEALSLCLVAFSSREPVSTSLENALAPGLDNNLGVALGIAQIGKRLRDAVDADFGGDQCGGFDLPLGNQPQRGGKFIGRVAQHILHRQFL